MATRDSGTIGGLDNMEDGLQVNVNFERDRIDMPPRATKIVATLGPASTDEGTLRRMFEGGVNVVRLNFSHGRASDHVERAATVRRVASEIGKHIGVLADLQGPKIRVGRIDFDSVMLVDGQPFMLDASWRGPGSSHRVGLDYPDLPRDVRAGDILLLDDGLLKLRVDGVEGDRVDTTVLVGGMLSSNKGINKQGGGLTAPALTAKDADDLATAMSIHADFIAVSFPKDARDMLGARRMIDVHAAAAGGHRPLLIAKIERAEAIRNLEEIVEASDGVMVARGDLAVEVGNASVPALQKRIIRLARSKDRLVITATQMMESMIKSPIPTRAEVSDVANAVLDGTDAVMLSAESATGRYPVETVQTMAEIAAQAERARHEDDFAQRGEVRRSEVDQAIAQGALYTAQLLGCAAIVVLTDSGSTPLWMSRRDARVPIFALTSRLSTYRKMAMYRNVHALLVDECDDREAALGAAERTLADRGILKSGDRYVITCGETMGVPGGTNLLKIVICQAG